jgi:hypothetical protein
MIKELFENMGKKKWVMWLIDWTFLAREYYMKSFTSPIWKIK